jgi:hypothetical protein
MNDSLTDTSRNDTRRRTLWSLGATLAVSVLVASLALSARHAGDPDSLPRAAQAAPPSAAVARQAADAQAAAPVSHGAPRSMDCAEPSADPHDCVYY